VGGRWNADLPVRLQARRAGSPSPLDRERPTCRNRLTYRETAGPTTQARQEDTTLTTQTIEPSEVPADVETPAELEGFHITTDEAANWLLGKLANLEA